MNPSLTKSKILTAIIPMICLGLLATPGSLAGDLDEVLLASNDRAQLAQASQQNIDRVVSETNTLEADYKQVMKQLDGLAVYNDYIERQIASQEGEMATLRESLDQVGVVERQIMPLMIRMLDGLDQFIQLDQPFLLEERNSRVNRLRALMERADVTLAENSAR